MDNLLGLIVAMVALAHGAIPPVLVGGCHGAMSLQEVAYMAHRR
jgi:hypothetical protein